MKQSNKEKGKRAERTSTWDIGNEFIDYKNASKITRNGNQRWIKLDRHNSILAQKEDKIESLTRLLQINVEEEQRLLEQKEKEIAKLKEQRRKDAKEISEWQEETLRKGIY